LRFVRIDKRPKDSSTKHQGREAFAALENAIFHEQMPQAIVIPEKRFLLA
jgi:hypothetical protein